MTDNIKVNKALEILDPLICIERIVEAYSNYQIIAEQEQTKRRDIAAWENTQTEKIRSEREILITYFDRSFDERSNHFQELFSKLDHAVELGDCQQIALILHAITDIARSSPFKELGNLNSIQKALEQPDYKWEF